MGRRLKNEGFRNKGRTFNREADDGIVHVIDLQMGRRGLRGEFIPNFGVFIADFHEVEQGSRPSFPKEAQCELRDRIDNNTDWWSLKKDNADTAKKIIAKLEKEALPLFQRIRSNQDVIQAWKEDGRDLLRRGGFVIGVLEALRGNRHESQKWFSEELAHTDHKGYKNHVREVAERVGIHLES